MLLITDRKATSTPLLPVIEAACRGGVTAVMLREKDLSTRDLVRLGREIVAACRDAGVTIVVNDDCEAASELAADGVHLGYRSVPVVRAREILGDAALVGRSTHDIDELESAISAGADYVTYGPIHDTPSKRGLLEPRGWDSLRCAVTCAGDVPVIALGGLGLKGSAGRSEQAALWAIAVTGGNGEVLQELAKHRSRAGRVRDAAVLNEAAWFMDD